MDLELKLQGTLNDIETGGGPTREKRSPTEWVPRPPEKFELKGHRDTVTHVVFHPTYELMASASEDATIKVEQRKFNSFFLIILIRFGIMNQVNMNEH